MNKVKITESWWLIPRLADVREVLSDSVTHALTTTLGEAGRVAGESIRAPRASLKPSRARDQLFNHEQVI